MKKTFLLAAACWICCNITAQVGIDSKTSGTTSDQWEVYPVKGLRKGMGRLSLGFPDSAQWSIDIFTAQKKFLINRSPKTFKGPYYELPAGIYSFKLNTVLVENVPIQEGSETRLKAGVLKIAGAGTWELRNESKTKFLTSGNQAGQLMLPVGKYYLKQAGGLRLVDIVDELGHSDDVYHEYETRQYILNPVENGGSRIITNFPMTNSGFTVNMFYTLSIHRAGESASIFHCTGETSSFHCPEYYSLPEGSYDIYFGLYGQMNAKTLKYITVAGVPVKKGYDTRIKVGYLTHKLPGIYMIFDETAQVRYLSYSFQNAPPPIPLPVGNYTIVTPNAGSYNIEVRDGIKIVHSPVDSFDAKSRWTMTMTKNDPSASDFHLGSILTRFPESNRLKFIIKIPDGSSYRTIKLDTLPYFEIKEGVYEVELNNMLFQLPVQHQQQTGIRYGLIKMGGDGSTFKDALTGKQFGFGIESTGIRALPVGFYLYKPYGQSNEYLFRLKEGETIDGITQTY